MLHLQAVLDFGGSVPADNISLGTGAPRKRFFHREKMAQPLVFLFGVIITDR